MFQSFDKKTYGLLKALYTNGKLTKNQISRLTLYEDDSTDPHIRLLLSEKLISYEFINARPAVYGGLYSDGYYYCITLRGRAYVEQRRRDFLLFLIPYTITTVIAILALLLAAAEYLR